MHCMVRLNDSHIISTGGREELSRISSSADLLSNSNWSPLPDLIEARHGHICGRYGKENVVVAGGLTQQNTEIFSLILMKW